VSAKPGSKKPAPQPAKARAVIMHWPSSTDEKYMLTPNRKKIAYSDKWLGYTWAITNVGKERRFAAIIQFERINPDHKIIQFVWGLVSKNGIGVPFSFLKHKGKVRDNLISLDKNQWTEGEITDVTGLTSRIVFC